MRAYLLPLVGALTTLATLGTIAPVFTGTGWVSAAAASIAAVVLTGMLLRSVRVGQGYCGLIQLLVGIIALLAFVTPQHMILAVIPTPEAVGRLIELIGEGAVTARSSVPPIAPTLGIATMLAALTLPIAVLVDDCVASGRAAVAGLPLLTLFAVSSAVVREPLSLVLLVLPLLGYATLLWLEESADRVHAPRLRTLVGALVAASVVLGAAVGAAAATSRLIALPEGGIFATSGGNVRTPDDTVARATDLAGQLSLQDPIPLFRVQTDDPSPYYLRTLVLEDWETQGWSYVPPEVSTTDLTGLTAPDLPATIAASTSTIEVLGYTDRFAPTYYAASTTDLENFSYDENQQVLFAPEEDSLDEGDTYQVSSSVPRPTAEELAAAGTSGLPTDVRQRNLEVPPDVDSSVVELTNQIVENMPTAYDAAIAIDAFFNAPASGFIYSLEVPDPGNLDPLASFLQQRQGFCEQYASAMAGMLRVAGVPSRVVVGYTRGTPVDDGVYDVTTSEAHAWVEAYFSGVGWVSFDPTPIGARAVPLPYVPRFATSPQQTPEDLGAEDVPVQTTTPAAPLDSPDLATGESATSEVLLRIAQVVAALAVLLAVAAVPGVIRHRRWRTRLRISGSGGIDGAEAAWRELSDLADDLGLSGGAWYGPVRAAAHWSDELTLGDDAALRRLAVAAEVAAYAAPRRSAEIADLSGQLRQVREQLLAAVDTRTRWRALALPASLLRLRRRAPASTS